MDFQAFRFQTERFSNCISKHQLGELRGILRKAHLRRFRHRAEPKYGSTNKAFTEAELQHFLRHVKSEKFRLLFRFQACLGLRVGEVARLHVSNIDFLNGTRELTIRSEKSQKPDSLKIPLDLYEEASAFVNKNFPAIEAAQGHIFFKENDNNNHNEVPHVDLNYVRKVFRVAVKEAGLAKVYDYSEETAEGHRERPLYRLTTHSLRHYAITRFSKAVNGNVVLTSRFARHSNPLITMRYIAKDNEQLYSEIDNAFSEDRREGIRALSDRFKKM